jgi:hypothetical protein
MTGQGIPIKPTPGEEAPQPAAGGSSGQGADTALEALIRQRVRAEPAPEPAQPAPTPPRP